MGWLGRELIAPWPLGAAPRAPSEHLLTHLDGLRVFDLVSTEQAKMLLIDTLFVEVVQWFPSLKVWKAEPLETDRLTGVADYLIAPRREYLATPLLCAVEAKRDDFERGRAQCLAELVACRELNSRAGIDVDLHGIVSNGREWQFYRLDRDGNAAQSEPFHIGALPQLLGALEHVCSECARSAQAEPGAVPPVAR
jgi:hypothetical protein